MGGNANCGCRKCKVGGPHDFTESDEGYHSLYSAGAPRTAAEVKACLERQLSLASQGIEKQVTDLQTATGTKDKVTQHWIDILIQKAREMKSSDPSRSGQSISEELMQLLKDKPGDKFSPLLDIYGLDPTQDTPVEILHMILLGIMKYIWHLMNLSWTDGDRAVFAIRLQSTDLDGLTFPPLRAAYMIQYRNNLIGKHFKTLMQTMAFHLHDLVSPQEFAFVKAAGALGALLWVHEIEDMDQYLKDLEVLVANVLDAFGEIDSSKIIIKIKLHLLAHLAKDIRRFGPAIRNSTEIFECFNAIFRLCSIYSNHQAPSRDIAYKFSSMDRLKHFLSGGYWKQGGEWVHAGQNVLKVLRKHAIIQRHLGWVPPVERQFGDIRMAGKSKNPPVSWDETLASKSLTLDPSGSTGSSWRHGLTVVAQSGDVCRKGSWVFFKDGDSSNAIGRLAEIVSYQNASKNGWITVENFLLAANRHPEFGLPVLRRPQVGSAKYSLIRSTDILFIFSVQHDCRLAHCEATLARNQVQERRKTSKEDKLIEHKDDTLFIINTYAIHNATLLRKVLPRSLTLPQPLHVDRKEYHARLSASLRISQNAKRAHAQAKRKATLAAKRDAQLKRKAIELEDENEVEDIDNEGQEGNEEIPPEQPTKKRQKR